ncbi:SRPBCC family protein [Streptomyces sp. MUM 178J]|uniref:SRPBCC family protein n=1 Tax=Streptomyces sp. MUM 178J TaxID=2791991 RepID=UPI001F04E7F8|nr:SRPBCC family protein [Streptomyces sp. MUM 178J]WRQ78197.1 SRPBCC family protein [Streptomyces sp. MUM 178J]
MARGLRSLRRVELDFFPSAPVRLVFADEIAATPEAVYRALADDVAGWPRWFTAVTSARSTRQGAGREIRLKGGTRFVETVLAAEPGARYVYRVDETDAPGPRALLEEWRLTPVPGGCRVQWTMAADGPAPLRIAMRLGRRGLARTFAKAVANLERLLARSTTP